MFDQSLEHNALIIKSKTGIEVLIDPDKPQGLSHEILAYHSIDPQMTNFISTKIIKSSNGYDYDFTNVPIHINFSILQSLYALTSSVEMFKKKLSFSHLSLLPDHIVITPDNNSGNNGDIKSRDLCDLLAPRDPLKRVSSRGISHVSFILYQKHTKMLAMSFEAENGTMLTCYEPGFEPDPAFYNVKQRVTIMTTDRSGRPQAFGVGNDWLHYNHVFQAPNILKNRDEVIKKCEEYLGSIGNALLPAVLFSPVR